MNEPALHCQGCGAALSSPDAVCAHCEAELTAEPPCSAGRFVCPHCRQRFAAPAQVPWPPNVAWWRPTTIRRQCPHCDTPLRDRRDLPLLRWVVIAVLGLMLYLEEFARSHHTVMRVALALMVALYAWQAWGEWKGLRDPHRFVAGTRQLWLRQLKDLTPAKRHDSNDLPH